MENNRTVNILIFVVIGGALLVFPLLGLAYDDKTTHPALTQEIINFFNKSFPSEIINSESAEKIIQGSIDEDKGIRWLHHFYDPVHNRGLTIEDATLTKNPNLAFIAGGARSEWESSKDWARDTALQNGFAQSLFGGIFSDYFSGTEDFSWERGVYEYAWGDKNRGLLTLGHTLHLLQDAAVPDHTRNDSHPPIHGMSSPYEDWAKQINRYNIDVLKNLKDKKPVLLQHLSDYFDALANYSNNNFFSKDTIFSKEYSSPKIIEEKNEILSNGINYKFGYYVDSLDNIYKIVRIDREIGTHNFIYSLKDADNLILSDYWSHLSKQAVLHGAGVIKLFFDDVKKEKRTKALYNKNRSWFVKKFDSLASGVFGINKLLYGSSITLEDLNDSPAPNTPPPPQAAKAPQMAQTNSKSNNNSSVAPAKTSTNTEILSSLSAVLQNAKTLFSPPAQNNVKIQSPVSIPPQPSSTSEQVPIAGVGGSAPPPSPQNSSINAASNPQNSAAPSAPPSNNSPPPSPNIASSSPSTDAPPPAPPPSSASSSPPSTTPPPPSAMPIPEISLSIAQCSQSMSSGNCLITTPTTTLAWVSSSTNIAYYSIICTKNGDPCPSFSFSHTVATSTNYTLPTDNETYSFSAKAIDASGNESTTATKIITYAPNPLVINEIAWAGTMSSHSQDEWVELFNPTAEPLNLSGIHFKSKTDEKPDIALTGIIPPHGYYTIERTDDGTISDIAASTTASFGSGSGAGLSNSGETLALEYHGAILDQTPDVEACSGWCGGNTDYYSTMERISPDTAGIDKTNWMTWAGFLQNGKAADGTTLIHGSPGKRNNANYLIDPSQSILTSDKILKKSGSPYIVSADFSIPSGKTLTVEAGTVIKLVDNVFFNIDGTLVTKGTESEPVVFTSLKDDSYGGDTNNDDAHSLPAPANWKSFKITGSGSAIDHTIFRYGGYKDLASSAWSLIHGKNCNLTIKNSTFEFSGAYGVWLENCSGTFDRNIVRHNTASSDGSGLLSYNTNLTITGNTFSDNYTGALLSSGDGSHTLSVSQNTFSNNNGAAIQLNGAYPTFSKNSAAGNGVNGISVAGGTLTVDYTFTSDLPYVMQGLTVPAGKTLTVDPGTVMKFDQNSGMSIYGTLHANGAAEHPIIFTSLKDDDCGISGGCGDTNNASATPAAGDWFNVSFLPGSHANVTYGTLRYGGGNNPRGPFGAMRIDTAAVNIDHTTIEHNRYFGIFTEHAADVSIANSIIQNHNKTAGDNDYGIYLTASSSPHVKNTIFRLNETNILNDSTSAFIDDGGNIFE